MVPTFVPEEGFGDVFLVSSAEGVTCSSAAAAASVSWKNIFAISGLTHVVSGDVGSSPVASQVS